MSLRKLVISIIGVIVGLTVIGMAGCPTYKVWSARKEGEAELAQATANRMIKVQEAEAQKEAAVKLAEAEVIRAEGAAKSAKVIGDSLKGNEGYMHYLWLQSLGNERGKDVVYIPTEANMPIMEANRLRAPAPVAPATTPASK